MNMAFDITTYESQNARPARRWVAIITRQGQLGPHMASTTFAPSEEEARRKATDAITAWTDPAKAHKHPHDLDTVPIISTDQGED